MNPLVSIVIPTFNSSEFITKTLESCLNQTYSNLEIICVDNGSIDNTVDILSKYAINNKITLLEEPTPGAPYARNKGLDHSKGKWIQFLDSDDQLLANKIEHQISILNEETDALISHFTWESLKGETKTISPNREPIIGIINSNFGHTSSILWKADMVHKVGKWDTTKTSSQEYNLLFEMYKSKAIFQFDEHALTLITNRESGQISSGNQKKKWYNYTLLRCEILEFLKETRPSIFEKKHLEIEHLVFNQIRSFAQYDINKAAVLYNKYCANFIPSNKRTIYTILLRLLGFKNVEKIKAFLKRD